MNLVYFGIFLCPFLQVLSSGLHSGWGGQLHKCSVLFVYPCLINALFTQAWTDADNSVGHCANILLNPTEHVFFFFLYI